VIVPPPDPDSTPVVDPRPVTVLPGPDVVMLVVPELTTEVEEPVVLLGATPAVLIDVEPAEERVDVAVEAPEAVLEVGSDDED
jgi:hypothetical protein